MRFTIAIIALLSLTNAIRVEADPVSTADPSAQAAAAPKAPATKEAAIVKEALKTEDEKVDEASNAAGAKIDISNVGKQKDAVVKKDAEGKVIPPKPLSDAENTRNSVVRNALGGQFSIEYNEKYQKTVEERFEKKTKEMNDLHTFNVAE